MKNKLSILSQYSMTILIGYMLAYAASQTLPEFYANVFFGTKSASFPISFQMWTWLPFFIGAQDIFVRRKIKRQTEGYLSEKFLSEDSSTIYSSSDLSNILRHVTPLKDLPSAVLPDIMYQVIVRFQGSKSASEATTTLTNFIDLYERKLDLAYSRIRYLSWLIPTLGFLGTVYGISETVASVGRMQPDDPGLLSTISATLAVAFDTTLLALVQSSILLYFLSIVEKGEETALNDVHRFVLEKLINRLDENG